VPFAEGSPASSLLRLRGFFHRETGRQPAKPSRVSIGWREFRSSPARRTSFWKSKSRSRALLPFALFAATRGLCSKKDRRHRRLVSSSQFAAFFSSLLTFSFHFWVRQFSISVQRQLSGGRMAI